MEHSTDRSTHLKTLLRTYGYSLTKARWLVFQAFTANPTTNARLGDKLDGRVDRASVYRTIAIFEKTDVIRRIWNGFKSQIELSDEFVPHHHHAQCRVCGTHIAIDSPAIEAELVKAAHEIGFNLEDHHIELIGICKPCAKSTTA